MKNKICILIVDDSPCVGAALKLVLESNGYDTVLVETGGEGIEQASNRRFGFGVVDLLLPDISGLQVIERIREHQPEIPILLVTGKGSPQVFDEARRLGAIGALNKPFHSSEILQLIEAAVVQ